MTAKPVFVFSLFFLSTVSAFNVSAQTYQWKDAGGRTVISDTPPPGNAKERRALGGQPQYFSEKQPEKTGEKTPAADSPKSTAEKELDFKKRQQESREKAEAQAKEQAAENARRDNCERARRTRTALESDRAITSLDEQGNRQIMDQSQRALEIERARQAMAESCK